MSLVIKNVIATLAVLLAVAIALAAFMDYAWPVASSWRVASVAVFALGLAACITYGSNVTPAKDLWTEVAAAIGVACGLAFFWTLFLDSEASFAVLIIGTVLLWLQTLAHQLWQQSSHHLGAKT